MEFPFVKEELIFRLKKKYVLQYIKNRFIWSINFVCVKLRNQILQFPMWII